MALGNDGPEARRFRNLYAIALWQTGELDAAAEEFTKLLLTGEVSHTREIRFNLAGVLLERNGPEESGRRSDAAEAQEILESIHADLQPGELPFRFPNEWLFIGNWQQIGARRTDGGTFQPTETVGPNPARAAEIAAEITTVTDEMAAITVKFGEAGDAETVVALARSLRELRAKRVDLIRDLAPAGENEGATHYRVLVSDLEILSDSTGDPRWFDWATTLTRLHIAASRVGDALALANRIIDSDRGRTDASAYFLRAQILMRDPATAVRAQNDVEHAMILSAELGIPTESEAQQAAFVRAIMDVTDGHAFDAEGALSALIATAGADPMLVLRARWYSALARLQMHRIARAREDLRAVLGGHPTSSSAWVVLARLELRGGDGVDAARAVIAEAWTALGLAELTVEQRVRTVPELVSLSALAAAAAGELETAARLADLVASTSLVGVRSIDRDMMRVDLAACAARAGKADAMWSYFDALSLRPLRLAERDYPEFAAHISDARFPRIYRAPRPDDVQVESGEERAPLPGFGD
jgi:hypothetical protein